MIMLKLKNADQETEIDFPCLHEHIRYRLEEIGLDGANAPNVLVEKVEAPRALSFLEGTYVNVDEINYLANEIESLEEIQAKKLYAIIAYKGYILPVVMRIIVSQKNCILSWTIRGSGKNF